MYHWSQHLICLVNCWTSLVTVRYPLSPLIAPAFSSNEERNTSHTRAITSASPLQTYLEPGSTCQCFPDSFHQKSASVTGSVYKPLYPIIMGNRGALGRYQCVRWWIPGGSICSRLFAFSSCCTPCFSFLPFSEVTRSTCAEFVIEPINVG